MDNRSLGRLIAERRRELGLTQRELAEKLNITDRAVSRWERGVGSPDISLIVPLAEALGLSTDQLLKGTSVKKQSDDDKRIYIHSDSAEGIPYFYFRIYRTVGWIGASFELLACFLPMFTGQVSSYGYFALYIIGAVIFLSSIFVVFPLFYRCPGCGHLLFSFNIRSDYAQHCNHCGKKLFSDKRVSTIKEYIAYRNDIK